MKAVLPRQAVKFLALGFYTLSAMTVVSSITVLVLALMAAWDVGGHAGYWAFACAAAAAYGGATVLATATLGRFAEIVLTTPPDPPRLPPQSSNLAA